LIEPFFHRRNTIVPLAVSRTRYWPSLRTSVDAPEGSAPTSIQHSMDTALEEPRTRLLGTLTVSSTPSSAIDVFESAPTAPGRPSAGPPT
jgi:hypothetical protein